MIGVLTIGSRNILDYTLTVRENESVQTRKARRTFNHYLQKTIGDSLRELPSGGNPYEIVICRCEEWDSVEGKDLGEDGFLIKNVGNRLYIAGGKRGVHYGVYSFFELLGWRYLTPTCEIEPDAAEYRIHEGLCRRETPGFSYRLPFFTFSSEPEFMLKSKINSMHMGSLEEEYGGVIEYAGPHFVHTFKELVPEEEFFGEHPEYFSLSLNGERVPTQLCLTNPELVDLVTERVRKWLLANPRAKLVSISQNDNQEYCCCNDCALINYAEGSEIGTLLRFVNAVAGRLKDEFPDVLFDTLAYQYTRRAPRITKPADNVVIRLCTIECCRAHAIDDPNCLMNRNFHSDLMAWKSLTDKIYIWDYVHNFSFHISPFPNFRTLRPNMNYFYRNHVVGMFVEGHHLGQGCEFEELRCYLVAKLLWKPDMDEDEYFGHLTDFMRGYYGAGYRYVLEFIDLIEDWSKENHYNIYHEPYIILPNTYAPDSTIDRSRIMKAYELFEKAEREAVGEEREHVKRSAMCVEFYDLFMTMDNRYFKGNETEREALLKEYRDFYARVERCNIEKIRGNVGGQMIFKGNKYY